VSAFDGTSYNVQSCGKHIATLDGGTCMSGGCKARLACPVGEGYVYIEPQIQFHMRAFLRARQSETA
jgi:hypothetical protein